MLAHDHFGYLMKAHEEPVEKITRKWIAGVILKYLLIWIALFILSYPIWLLIHVF